jgi:Tol biopolymer transport system component/DNA-binding winged helix-turn-helix (wHTH) protein
MSSGTSNLYEFGSYRLDVAQRVVTREGQSVPLAPKPFALLLLLVQSPRRAFSKQELMAALWPDTFVEEANLSFQISVLRKALGEDGGLIETVPKHGYRFGTDVRTIAPVDTAAPITVEEVRPSPTLSAAGTAKNRMWVITAILAAVFVSASYLLLSVRPRSQLTPVAAVAVPLTSYPGFEGVPTLSPDGSQVAFTWDGPGEDNTDVYVKLVGPGEPFPLTKDPRVDFGPSWSPDGSLIAFERFGTGARDVIVVPALGGAEHVIATIRGGAQTGLRGNLAWTPDGKWIAVGGRPSDDAENGIWLVSVEGANRRQLTRLAELDAGDTSPAFSPDGRHIAFVRARKNGANAIYVLALSSTLTAAGQPFQVTAEGWNMLGLAWSADGRNLIFSSGAHNGIPRLHRIAFSPTASPQRASPEGLPFGEQATAITISRTGRLVYATQSRDTGLWKVPLTMGNNGAAPALVAASTYDELTPDYSRDGRRLAFTSNRSGAEEIYIADADGSNPVKMTSMNGPLCANPRWSPTGDAILFSSRRDGSQDLYLLSPDTLRVLRITDDPGEETQPRWSRNGELIYFGSNRTGRHEVWKMPRAGGPAERITQHGGLSATESPDRRFLYYAKHGVSPTSIWRVPVNGGEETVVVDGVSNSLNFVVANRGLYFLAVADATPGPPAAVFHRATQRTSIDFFEFATGKRTTLFQIGKQAWAGMALSHDERSLLYSVMDSAGGNLMLVDTFR